MPCTKPLFFILCWIYSYARVYPIQNKTKGEKMSNYKLLGVGNNAKTIKGDGSEYLTAIMYLSPADKVEGVNLCPMAVLAGCKEPCLDEAGRGQMNVVQRGRMRKTVLWRDFPEVFLAQLHDDLRKFQTYCLKRGITPCVRLNGTSDIRWEKHIDMEKDYPDIQFYDYTKDVKRVRKKLPKNYHLTLSYSRATIRYSAMVLDEMRDRKTNNMAVVFRHKHQIPKKFMGFDVVDGDKDDLRFLDPKGVVVALYAKGKARYDNTGFVIDA